MTEAREEDRGRSRRLMLATGGEVAFTEREGEGVPVLFVHGFPFDRSMWAEQFAGISGHRLLAPDLRGFGESAAATGPMSMAGYADDLAALLDALKVDRAVLAGLSMGGYVVLEFARRFRERLIGTVLMDTRSEADSAEGRAGRDAAMRSAAEQGARVIAAGMLPKLFAASTGPQLRARFQAMMERAPVPGIVAALGAMRDRADTTEVLPGLAGIPTLIVVGAEDAITPPAAARHLAEGVPGASLLEVPEAGHLAPAEQPGPVNAALQEFLDGVV